MYSVEYSMMLSYIPPISPTWSLKSTSLTTLIGLFEFCPAVADYRLLASPYSFARGFKASRIVCTPLWAISFPVSRLPSDRLHQTYLVLARRATADPDRPYTLPVHHNWYTPCNSSESPIITILDPI